jgi:hypothetical protein
MTRKNLLRTSAFFTLFTFVGHTIGLIRPLPEDQTQVLAVYQMMKQTLVPFPMGAPKSIATLMIGANTTLSVLLFLTGVSYLFLATDAVERSSQRQLMLLNISMLAVAITSYFCFFPLPAICTGLATVLGFVAFQKKN